MLSAIVLAAAVQMVASRGAGSPRPPDPEPPLPELILTADNTSVDRSCRVVIPPDTVIADADHNGVLHIAAGGVTVEFAPGSVLRGAAPSVPDDALAGVAIALYGHRNVKLRGIAVEGYRCAVHAKSADGLIIEGASIARGRRPRLASTPRTADSADALRPHEACTDRWVEAYGAAVYIERSTGVTVRTLTVRGAQIGIMLNRVSDSRLYDNDCSFLSGWGLAMRGSVRNLISRNAFDFCIRGYSHGVYARAHGAAGILAVRGCADNTFIENSATHCGSGFIALGGGGGKLRGSPGPASSDGQAPETGRNVLRGNDFSFAAGSGVELHDSAEDRVIDNRLAGNALCGLLGNRLRRTHILSNQITGNGLPGTPRDEPSLTANAGIALLGGDRALIAANLFQANAVGVALQGEPVDNPAPQPETLEAPAGHVIIGNHFTADTTAVRVRKFPAVTVNGNFFNGAGTETDLDPESAARDAVRLPHTLPDHPVAPAAIGDARPVGARRALGGREGIFMSERGPWDHQSPMLRLSARDGPRDTYELFGNVGPMSLIGLDGGGDIEVRFGDIDPSAPRPMVVSLRDGLSGVRPYEFRILSAEIDHLVHGTLINTHWSVRVFSWDERSDPRTDLAAWRLLAAGDTAAAFSVDSLGGGWLDFDRRGPRDIPFLAEHTVRLPGPDRFGLTASTRWHLPAGHWRLTTRSDDGVRLTVNGRPLIENWTQHERMIDTAVFHQATDGPAEIKIEYFEIEGDALLGLTIEPDR